MRSFAIEASMHSEAIEAPALAGLICKIDALPIEAIGSRQPLVEAFLRNDFLVLGPRAVEQ